MKFDIYPPSRKLLSAINGQFGLQQDNWDDYNFKTTYGLYYQNSKSADLLFVGGMKILKRGQKEREPLQITDPFNRLDDQWCSVGGDLDYYERLSTIDDGDRHEILIALRDVVANPALIPEFQNELGWRKSLFRDNSRWDRFLDDATAVQNKDFSKLANLETPFSFRPNEASDVLPLHFSAPPVPNYYQEMRKLGSGPIKRVGIGVIHRLREEAFDASRPILAVGRAIRADRAAIADGYAGQASCR